MGFDCAEANGIPAIIMAIAVSREYMEFLFGCMVVKTNEYRKSFAKVRDFHQSRLAIVLKHKKGCHGIPFCGYNHIIR